MTAAGIVLAGGASSRFGGDKLAAPYRGEPVLHHALRAVAAVAEPVVLVLAPGAPVPPLPAEVAHAVIVARDAEAHQGPLAGLAGGLGALAGRAERVIVVAGDMPSLVPAVLEALLAVLDSAPEAAVACLETVPFSPLPMAVRPSIVAPAAATLLGAGRRSLRGLVAGVDARGLPAVAWRALDPDGDTLRDIDTPADL